MTEAADLAITPGPDGALLRVRAVPGSRRERVVGVHGDALKVAVTAPAERGRANDRLIRVLAKALGLPWRAFSLAAGATSRDKRLHVAGVSAEELRRRVAALLASTGS